VLAGLSAGLAGLATSYLTSALLELRGNPVTQVAELVIKLTPGKVAETVIQAVGHKDKPLLVTGVLVVLLLFFAGIGLVSRRSIDWGIGLFLALGVVGLVAQQSQFNAPILGVLPVVIGVLTWTIMLGIFAAQLRPRPFVEGGDTGRRYLLLVAGVGVGSAVLGGLGWKAGGRLRKVDAARRSLKLTGVTAPRVPAGTEVGLGGLEPWATPASRFYRIDTSLSPPAIAPADWSLRIHGMVDHEMILTYDDLLARKRTEAWVTLNCVSNTVGGHLISNAWWSGVRLRCPQADLRRRVDLWDPDLGGHRRPRRHAGHRDERSAAADRARVPRTDRRTRPLRLRVGLQVAARHRGDDVRLVHGLLDRSRLVGQGPGQAGLAHRRPARRALGVGRPGAGRGSGLEAGRRDRRGGDPARRRRLAAGPSRPDRARRRVGPVGRDPDGAVGRPHAPGPGDQQGR
jgi:hypothetical protein